MAQQLDGVHYAVAKLVACKTVITRYADTLEENRAGVEKYMDTKKSRAARFYDELRHSREQIVDAINDSRLALMELGDAQLSEYAGTLAVQLAAFNLMTKSYTTLIGVLTAFADKLPDADTTNASVIGRLMNKVRMGYYVRP